MVALRIRPVIILFGDSITQEAFGINGAPGWASLLSNAYIRRADVLNRGFSGYNTRHCLDIVHRVFGDGHQIVFCTVLLGANDASLAGERQHVPIDEYEENLGKIVTSIRSQTSSQDFPIILMTPPPLDAPAWESSREEPSRRSNEAVREYGDRVKKVGLQYKCPVFDAFDALGGYGHVADYGKNLRDGLHLNGSGNTRLFEGLLQMIRKEMPHLAPVEDGSSTGIPMEEKLWTDLC